jgi:type I restriction enzyme M protein
LRHESGEPAVDCDFAAVRSRIAASDAAVYFTWLGGGQDSVPHEDGWAVNISHVYSDSDLTLDPKRYSRKAVELRSALASLPHFELGEAVDFIPEGHTSGGCKAAAVPSAVYRYVELQDIGYGDFRPHEMRGWELPGRAKHFAEPGDVFFGSIWGSATKWCYIPDTDDNIVVTNGCFRCRMKAPMDRYLPDLLSYLGSEGWGVQMRSFSRGSDGLAEVSLADAKKIIIPVLSDGARRNMSGQMGSFQCGKGTVSSLVESMRKSGEISYPEPPKRPSHIVLV